MAEYTDDNDIIRFIIDKREESPDWTYEEILTLGGDKDISEVLKDIHLYMGKDLTESQWRHYVDRSLYLLERKVHFKVISDNQTISNPNIRLPLDPNTKTNRWDQYRKTIEDSIGIESALQIEASCKNILSRLTLKCEKPLKGLVHGSVQSGKTANMAGLIALAADYGFNVFVVFTGNITALNDQTDERFRNDLAGVHQYNFLTTNDLERGSLDPVQKNICVSMKTNSRIKKIIKWLSNSRHNRSKYKILIIDDEADYASVNSAPEGRPHSKTNLLLRHLVNGKNAAGKQLAGGYYGSLNYIAYTATPYSNLLNENEKDSLYPGDFIVSIPTSNCYFGPQQIFGVTTDNKHYEGLPIVNISNDLDENFRRFEEGRTDDIPEELKECLAWFVCSVAALRVSGYKEPLTMMINTSPKTDPHLRMGRIVAEYIDEHRSRNGEIRKYCKIVYDRQTRVFPKSGLLKYYPDYCGDSYSLHENRIIDYPSFEDLEEQIDILLGEKCGHIKGDEDNPVYSTSLHICLENSKKEVIDDDPVEVISRIRYPKDEEPCPDAPAFIVIGGNVLSRGLTLKGLISTFFLRPIKQADTLMQMGRWFGFRQGYELFPRIWISDNTYRDYEYLARLDEELKEEIVRCNDAGKNPSECAIRMLAIPSGQRLKGALKTHSARTKMKKKITSDVSYIGKYEEFATFKNDETQLKNNYDLTVDFLNDLERNGIRAEYPDREIDKGWNVYRWRGVSSEVLLNEYIKKFHAGVVDMDSPDNPLQMFIKWMENIVTKGLLEDWNILLAGNDISSIELPETPFEINERIRIGKVNRAKQKYDVGNDNIVIKTLRNNLDRFKDVFPHEFENKHLLNKIREGPLSKELRSLEREEEGIRDQPLMIIYCIDKDSKSKDPEHKFTIDLEACMDVVAFLVEIPNTDTRDSDMVQIELDVSRFEDSEE